jgi:hypothetical protein
LQKNTNIIGVSGKGNSGKDTVAKFIISNFNYVNISFADPIKRFVSDIFDMPDKNLWGPSEFRSIKDKRYPRIIPSFDVGDAFEAARYGLEDPGKIEYISARDCLQTIGESVRRLYKDAWADYGIKVAQLLLEGEEPEFVRKWVYSPEHGLEKLGKSQSGNQLVNYFNGVVISDARYINELEKIRSNGGLLIRVSRSLGGLTGEASQHPSEIEMDELQDDYFDFVINNNGSLDELYSNIEKIFYTLKNPNQNDKKIKR